MLRRSLVFSAFALLAISMASAASAFTWNREVLAANVTADNLGAHGHVHVGFSMQVLDSTAALLNFDTVVGLRVDDGPLLTTTVTPLGFASAGKWGYCRTGCNPYCINIPCEGRQKPVPPYDYCACAVLAIGDFNAAVYPGSVLHVTLSPAPGAQAEEYTGDDATTAVVPVPVPPSTPAVSGMSTLTMAITALSLLGIAGVSWARLRGAAMRS